MSNRRSGRNGLNVANLSIPVISNVDHVESVLEQFFILHTNFLWDKAKEYIERERDVFRAGHHSHCSSILASLMNSLAALTLADKNYLTLQFFSSKVFQRKDSVKVSYENLRLEFLRLEERGCTAGQQRTGSQQNTPHHQNHLVHGSPGSGNVQQQLANEQAQDVFDVEELFGNEEATANSRKSVSPVQLTDAEHLHLTTITPTPPKTQSFISRLFKFSSSKSSLSRNQSLSPSTPGNDFSIGSIDDASLTLSESTLLKQELACSLESMDRFAAHLSGQLVHYVKVRLEMIDLYDRLSSICLGGRKFVLLEDVHMVLKETHISADRNFHHPVLNRLKAMFMFEADVLLSLLTVHMSIQSWRFLEALFKLQDASNKLNMMANSRDQMLNHMSASLNSADSLKSAGLPKSGSGIVSPLMSSANNNNNAANLRRNFTNASLSSSGSSTLSVPTGPNAGNLPSATSNVSPSNPALLNFIFPSGGGNVPPKSLFFASSSGKSSSSAISANMPLLIQWLHRYKLYLLSKYSFYFHSLLMVHLTPASISSAASLSASASVSASSSFSASIANSASSLTSFNHHGHQGHSSSANYAAMEAHMRALCAKQCPPFDFHSKIAQFVRKMDCCYVILIFDINDQEEFNVSGYRSPFLKKELPVGIKRYPIVYAYPVEFPQNHMPSLIMTMGEKRAELNSSDTVLVLHNRPNAGDGSSTLNSSNVNNPGSPMSVGPAQIATPFTVHNIAASSNNSSSNNMSNNANTIPSATYFLVRPDPLFTMVMICEKPKADTETVVKFMTELTGLLKGSRIFAALRNGTLK